MLNAGCAVDGMREAPVRLHYPSRLPVLVPSPTRSAPTDAVGKKVFRLSTREREPVSCVRAVGCLRKGTGWAMP